MDIYYLVFLFPMDHHFLLFGCLYLLAVQFLFLLVPLVYLSMSPEVSSHCAGFCPTPAGISWSSCLVKEDMVEATFIDMLVMSWPSLLSIFQNPLSDVRILDISLVLEELMSEYLDVSTLRNIQVQHAAMFNEDWSTAYEVCWQASGAAPRSWWKNLGMDCHPGIS